MWPKTKRELLPSDGEYGFAERTLPRSARTYRGRMSDFDMMHYLYVERSFTLSALQYENVRMGDFFVALYNVELLNKLSGKGVVNGEHLVEELHPDYTGIAHYKLETWKTEAERLDELGLIRRWRLRTPTHGYGYDEGFYITDEALELIADKSEKQIRRIVDKVICQLGPLKPIDED